MNIIKWITDRLAAHRGLSREDEDYQRLLYMVRLFYINITKFAVTFGLAWLLGIHRYFFFFSIIYGVMRSHGFGIHLRSSAMCTISGAVVYYGCIYMARLLLIPNYIYILLFIAAGAAYRRYGPAESENQPIGKLQKERLRRRLTVILLVLCLAGLANQDVYRNLIILAVIAELLNILPVTYKIIERWEL